MKRRRVSTAKKHALRICPDCEKDYRRTPNTKCCFDCSIARTETRAKITGAAHLQVQKAIKRGDIPPAKTLKCMDCGKNAFCYDHRDYRKPLSVDPVCKRCDVVRGAGSPYDGEHNGWNLRRLATAERLGVKS